MKAFVLFNPSAGLKDKKHTEDIVLKKLESLGYEADLFYLDKKFEDKLEKYAETDIKLAVAVGGDGTVKVLARTIIESKWQCPLLIVPFGSCNVVAITLGIPLKVKAALNLLDGECQRRKIDVGLINKIHYFLVGFSVGYVSKFIIGTSKDLKNRYGFFGYLFTFIFNKIKLKKIRFEIQTQNRTFWVKGNSLIIFNALNYFGLTPKKPVDLSDGVFNLYVLTNKSFWTLIQAFFYMLWYQKPPKHIFNIDNNYFKIKLSHGVRSCQIDGDHIRVPRKLEVKVLRHKLEVITPVKNDKNKQKN